MSIIRSEGTEGKVAQILSPTEIAINIGRRDGVRAGDVFAVLASNALEIVDPDSGEVLGNRTLEKARVTIREAQERFSVGLAESRLPTYNGSLGSLRLGIGGEVPPGAEVATLPADDRYVKRGDQVRLIEEAVPF